MKIIMEPIGYIKSPYKEKEDMPRQSVYSQEKGQMEIEKSFADGLYSLQEGQYIEVIFYLDRSIEDFDLKFVHHGSGNLRGVFNTRSPNRPNKIGKSIVQILKIQGTTIEFKGVDMLDGTPVLDIKPYVKELNPI